jgi:hypothetical protein
MNKYEEYMTLMIQAERSEEYELASMYRELMNEMNGYSYIDIETMEVEHE